MARTNWEGLLMRVRASSLLALLTALVCIPRSGVADTLYLDDEAGFLDDAGELAFESFEHATVTDELGPGPIVLSGFTISTSSAPGSGIRVLDEPIPGTDVTPTHGSRFVHWDTDDEAGDDTLTFTFDVAITEFGVTLKDALDAQVGGFARLHVSTNGGASFENFLTGLRPSGEVHFVGIIADAPFTTLTITNGLWNDGVSVDAVHYTPEPSTSLLFAAGICALALRQRCRKR
jgi:hypothetical protein